ncbi:MAG TPA: phage baseplate assembly protein V [Candidatus Limnocylindrales bacterium]|nr:phage baseplate assembly protein V [Candidatus Limnocylindrales bacterium]
MSLLDALTGGGQSAGRTYGVAAGIVTNNQDPDGLGRVKIKFPWLSEDNETGWVRIATFMTGNERGSFFLPEVGDEVLVAFGHGDINQPYVVGALWSGKDKPPETNSDGKNNIRKLRSRSGHEIIFNDDSTTKKEKIEIHTKAKHKIILDDSAGGEKIEIVDKTGNNKIIIDSTQNSINIESTMQLKIKSQIIEIEAGGNMTIKSVGILTLSGSLVKIN